MLGFGILYVPSLSFFAMIEALTLDVIDQRLKVAGINSHHCRKYQVITEVISQPQKAFDVE